jgi:5-methylthioadenosine/S-adenosylhomocysteine deaminase
MLENGMNVALGMDSTAINDDDDMLQELRLCSYLQRTPGWERSSPSTGQLLKMATVNGANVTPFVGEVGTLEKGKRADIILVDVKNINEPYLDSEIGIVDALVARGKGRDVDTVMIDGEIVMRDRELTRINRNEIISRLRESYGRATSDEKLRILVHDVLPYVSDFYQERDKSGKIPDYTYNCLDQ